MWHDHVGAETISHLRELDNGGISVLFHAFEGEPSIVRIYGAGALDSFPAIYCYSSQWGNAH